MGYLNLFLRTALKFFFLMTPFFALSMFLAMTPASSCPRFRPR